MMNKKYVQPRIKPIYPIYRLDEKTFRIGAQLGITKEFGDPEGKLWKLSNYLDGRKLNEIINNMINDFPDLDVNDVIYGIEILDEQGFIEETLEKQENFFSERYKPNISYFSRYIDVDKNRYDIQKKINESTILLLGLGGGGANILTLLAGIGPYKIKIVDYDKVEEANMGRQLLYKEKDIGKLKVEVAAKTISEMNSSIQIEYFNKKIQTSKDDLNLLDNVDIVICAIDEPPFQIQRVVNKAIVKANVPCVFGASQVSRGRVFTVVPGQTGCFDCLHIHYTLMDSKFVDQFLGFQKIEFNPPSIAYAPAIFHLTAAIVDEVVRVLTGYAVPRSLSRQYEINYEDGSAFQHPAWPRYADKCPTCGNGKENMWEVFQCYEKKYSIDNY